jgi:hypothetical protein
MAARRPARVDCPHIDVRLPQSIAAQHVSDHGSDAAVDVPGYVLRQLARDAVVVDADHDAVLGGLEQMSESVSDDDRPGFGPLLTSVRADDDCAAAVSADEAVSDVRRACALLLAPWADRGQE